MSAVPGEGEDGFANLPESSAVAPGVAPLRAVAPGVSPLRGAGPRA